MLEERTVPSCICMQLLRAGRHACHPFCVSALAAKSPISPFEAKELSMAGVQQTIKDFTNAAVLAEQAVYDGVEVMGSEGCLLTQFLSPGTNFRKNTCGGIFEKNCDPKIPGVEHAPNVHSHVDVLKCNKPVGKRVAIVGAGGIGFCVAEFLLCHDDNDKDKTSCDLSNDDFFQEWGIDPKMSANSPGGLLPKSKSAPGEDHKPPKRQLHLMQRKQGKLGANLGKTTGWIHRHTLRMGHVENVSGVSSYDQKDEHGHLHCATKDKKQHVLEVDGIVLCAGQVEHRELEEEAKSNTDLAAKVEAHSKQESSTPSGPLTWELDWRFASTNPRSFRESTSSRHLPG